VLDKIKSARDTLTRSELKVAELIMAQPDHAVGESIAALAEHAGVSEPTVLRFCRALGCRGYQDFKLRLAQDLATGLRYGVPELEPTETAGGLLAKVIDGAVSSLIKLRNMLVPEAVERAIDLLAAAERIEFYGLGGSGIVAADAQHKFFRLGVPVVAYSDPTIFRVAAALMGPAGIVVAISQTGRTRELLTSIEAARTSGAEVIAITSAGSPLAKVASVALQVNLLADEDTYAPIKSRMAHLAVIDVLAVGVALRRGPSFLDSLALTQRSQGGQTTGN
jgi:RpiR family carbohydrate utilization transcriptional regulator